VSSGAAVGENLVIVSALEGLVAEEVNGLVVDTSGLSRIVFQVS
jgi:hypothetical protein